MPQQVEKLAACLRSVRQIVRVAPFLIGGARPTDLVRLTWFITDRAEYVAASKQIGAVYREIIGNYYPPMSVIVVKGLLEPRALVEIEATAVIPEHPL